MSSLVDKLFFVAVIILDLLCVVLAVVILLSGCSDGCPVGETRCNGQTVEICNSDNEWESIMNCAEAWPAEWYCVEADTDGDTDPATVEESAHCEQVTE